MNGTTYMGLFYTREVGKNLIVYCDNDYVGDIEGRKSTSNVFKIPNAVDPWSSKTQPVVSLSTTEVEFISTAACAAHNIWMIRVLEKMGIKQEKCIIRYDNSSTIKLLKKSHYTWKSKHIHVQFHFLRELAN